jgi:hypothetical protein
MTGDDFTRRNIDNVDVAYPTAGTFEELAGTNDTTQTTAYHEVLSSLEDEIRCLVGETSEKFVPAPTQDQVLADAIESLRRFKESVRWRAFFRTKKLERIQKQQQQNGIPPIQTLGSHDSGGPDDQEADASDVGLRTGLSVKAMGSVAPRADDTVELFLKRVEDEVLQMAFNYNHHSVETKRSQLIRKTLSSLQHTQDKVVVPTDKTNSFRIIPIQQYINQMHHHLATNATKISRARLTEVVDDASILPS